jgi:NTE family protein
MPPTAVLSAFMPVGNGSLERVGHLIDAITPFGEWSPHPSLWVVAMDYEAGHRVVFGREDAPSVSLADAVMASCAIPGWFEPVTIDQRTYLDGGAWSATSADVLAGADLDEVYVVAPMVSFETDKPESILTRLERRWRESVTRRCESEVEELRGAGIRVTVLGPGREDLEAMGGNIMDGRRRLEVLETSLRTSRSALEQGGSGRLADTG